MLDIVLGATAGGDVTEVQFFVSYLNLANTAQYHRGHRIIGGSLS